MRKLALADIRGAQLYEPIRDDLRKRIIELKKLRRVSVGPMVTLVFENRATVIFQVEEMCRAEKISAPDKIREEIAVYNQILPDQGELGATLFVEITDMSALTQTLDNLVGLQNHVHLMIGDERVSATFDPAQFASDKLAAVQYLRFALPESARSTLRTAGAKLSLSIDHANYRHCQTLAEETRAELAKDLAKDLDA